MTYTRSIPVSGETLGGTRDRIRTNFEEIFDVFAQNHANFDALAKGKHTFLQMPAQASSPITLLNEIGVVALNDSAGITQLYFKGANTGAETTGTATNLYQLTRGTSGADANIASFGTNTEALASANGFGGWTFLPGNLLLQYGRFNPNASTTVRFPRTFTAPPYSVQLTLSASNNSTFRVGVRTGTLTASQFVFEGTVNSNSNPIYFMAIGQ